MKQDTNKMIEKFVFNIEKNILNFSLNKCVADIYTLFNYLEKEKVYLQNSDLSKKILVCLYPIIPNMALNLYMDFYLIQKILKIGQKLKRIIDREKILICQYKYRVN